jgi:leucyl aminopeptidase
MLATASNAKLVLNTANKNPSMLKIDAVLPSQNRGGCIAVFAYQKSKKVVGAFVHGSRVERALLDAQADGFDGKIGQTALVRSNDKSFARVIVVGLGSENKASLETARRAVAAAVRRASQIGASTLSLRPPLIGSATISAQAAAEGAFLGNYKYTRYKTQNNKPEKLTTVSFIAKDASERKQMNEGIALGRVFSDATIFARNLINQGPSDTTPEIMVKAARSIATGPVKLKVFNKNQIEKLGMGGLLGVNRGSAQPPAFLHWSYKPARGPIHRKIGICGKGITFDSGGLSLKPPKSMETMKMDMSGAAAVFAVFKALATLKPQVEVHGFTPLTENMPGGRATKPGDILKTMRGKTIEVLNTDAEGRLVLADALSYACRQNTDEILDLATLTGACVVALGNDIAGIMGTDSKLVSKIKDAAQISGEKVWELPLEDEYRSHMDSPIADIKNIGRAGEAGTIIGGLFLKEFVDEGKPWVHIDIAGPAWTDSQNALSAPGGTGVMVRTLLHHILSYN